jgi:Fe-S-cluster containining protein
MSEILKRVQELLKMPQELCNTCGKCCKIATFKGGLSYEQVKELSVSTTEDPIQVDGAKDFLTIFVPYDSTDDARKISNEFIENTLGTLNKKEGEMTFFYCKFLTENNLCAIHEDRPLLCRMYPIPHERTLYLPECGFAETGRRNWKEIEKILIELEQRMKPDNR